MKQFFITATDTDAGKTHVTSLLLKLAVQHKRKALGFKPIAAGAEQAFGRLVNTDALTLIESGNTQALYEQVNPFIYEPPIAPHIAAAQQGEQITLAKLNKAYEEISALDADILLTEGAGGWLLPINDQELLSDWVVAAKLPVILVVGMKLGCLNHALLTMASLQQQGVEVAGWIANQVDPDMAEYDANLATLKARMPVPMLAESPYTEGTPKLRIHGTLLDVLALR
ncbi:MULTISPECIES: dethiobiotin synthase [unclassified Pseudoalteromonas]|uniref:dethiobiotin synthase n=1 Tax=unclassified Pseudoalteromonas TaxID=194690 RepID=UPI000CF6C9F3|nr:MULTISPECIES: dethiobiotin synthase [unclassified Pseudoalteromonas]